MSCKMASMRTDILLLVAILFVVLYLKNWITGLQTITNDIEHTFTRDTLRKCFSFLRRRNEKKPICLIKKLLICLLLINCGDIEQCPGPATYSESLKNVCNSRGMKIAHLNIQAITTSYNGICDLLGNNPDIDILTLSETHLTSQTEHNSEIFKIEGYVFERLDRKNGPWGGVGMYIKEGINYKRRDDLERNCLESLWIEIFINNAKSLLMTSLYRPPNDSKYLAKNFDEQFNDLLLKVSKEKKEVIILGDLNSDYLVKSDNDNVKNILTIHGFKQLITKPTRVTKNSKTLIDIIATNKENISKTDVIPVSLSDHDMVICVRKLNHMKYKTRYVTSRNYTKYDPGQLQRDLKNTDFSDVFNENNVQKATENFTNILTNVFQRHAPIVKKRHKGNGCRY